MPVSSLARPLDFLAAPTTPPARRSIAPALPAAASTDRQLLGILAILGSTVCFPLSDLSAQSLMSAMPPLEVAALRYVVFFLAALPLLARGGAAFASARPGLQILRGAMVAIGTMAALIAFKVMPVPETTAIGFICPVFVTALAMFILGETVGPRRWMAALVALAGVMIIVQPGGASFRAVALLPLLGAAAGATAVICTRLNRSDDPRTTILYTATIGVLIMAGAAAASGLVMPTAAQMHVILVVGVFGTAGSMLQVVGYRLAAASLLAPFSYMQLIVASGLTFALSGALPTPAMMIGVVLIAGSAIYTGYRERIRGIA